MARGFCWGHRRDSPLPTLTRGASAPGGNARALRGYARRARSKGHRRSRITSPRKGRRSARALAPPQGKQASENEIHERAPLHGWPRPHRRNLRALARGNVRGHGARARHAPKSAPALARKTPRSGYGPQRRIITSRRRVTSHGARRRTRGARDASDPFTRSVGRPLGPRDPWARCRPGRRWRRPGCGRWGRAGSLARASGQRRRLVPPRAYRVSAVPR